MNRFAILAATSGVCLILTGCSGSSSPGATSSTTQPSTPAASASPPSLASIAFTAEVASQVGGVPVASNPHVSTAIGAGTDATLDLCGATFPSEALRVQRYQVFFLDAAHPDRQVESNEVVRYRPGGATQAYGEVRAAARLCKPVTVHGVHVSAFVIQPPDPRLTAEQLTVVGSQTSAKGTVWSVAVFQYRGDLFDGVYVLRQTKEQALGAAKALSELAAQRLTASATG